MVTKAQAMQETQFHYTGRHECRRTIGPRGGVTVAITNVRASGKCHTWKTRPDAFRLPIKYGLYESAEITERNAHEFHVASECPLMLWPDAAVFVDALGACYAHTPHVMVRAPRPDELRAIVAPWAVILASADTESVLSGPTREAVLSLVNAQDLSADAGTRRIVVAPKPGVTRAMVADVALARSLAHA